MVVLRVPGQERRGRPNQRIDGLTGRFGVSGGALGAGYATNAGLPREAGPDEPTVPSLASTTRARRRSHAYRWRRSPTTPVAGPYMFMFTDSSGPLMLPPIAKRPDDAHAFSKRRCTASCRAAPTIAWHMAVM